MLLTVYTAHTGKVTTRLVIRMPTMARKIKETNRKDFLNTELNALARALEAIPSCSIHVE